MNLDAWMKLYVVMTKPSIQRLVTACQDLPDELVDVMSDQLEAWPAGCESSTATPDLHLVGADDGGAA